MKKLLGVLAVAFVVLYVLNQPHAAAHNVRGVLALVGGAFNALITFVNTLFK